MRYIYSILLSFILIPFQVVSQDILHLQNASSFTIQTNAQVTIAGGVRGENGSSLLLNGDLYIKNNLTANQADWSDLSAAGIFDGTSTGKVFFQSDQLQMFNGNTIFPSVYMEGAGGLTLNNNLTVKNILHLTTGKVSTGNNFVVLQNTAENALEADATNVSFFNSWVEGNIRRFFNSSSPSYTFASGTTDGNQLVFLNNTVTPVSGINYLDAKFVAKSDPTLPVNLTEDGKTFIQVLSKGVWYLTPDQLPSGGMYDLKLYVNGFSPIVNNNFILVRRPDASVSDLDWEIPAGSNINAEGGDGRNANDGYALRKNISGFSQFGIAVTASALPVRLSMFSAIFRDDAVKLQWQTASEQNSSHFNIQRSTDRITFMNIGRMDAAGNSNSTKNYSYIDAGAINLNIQKIYYRLQQIDLDGKMEYSRIINLTISQNDYFTIKPNPASGDFIILAFKRITTGDNASIVITDMQGRKISEQQIQPGATSQTVSVKGISKGVYLVTLVNNIERVTQQFLKQ